MQNKIVVRWLGVLLLVVGLGSAGWAQQLDRDHGFLGFELGQEKDSLLTTMVQKRGYFQKLLRYDLLPEHRVLTDIMLEAPIELRSVRFFFYDSHLHSIEVKALGQNGEALRNWILDRYGEGEKNDAMGFKFTWREKKTFLRLEQNLVTKDVLVTFRDHKTHNHYYRFMYNRTYGQ